MALGEIKRGIIAVTEVTEITEVTEAVVEDIAWAADVVFEANWSGAAFGYGKIHGMVHLKGLVEKSIGAIGGETMFTLPEGFRPPATRMVNCSLPFAGILFGAPVLLEIAASGAVAIHELGKALSAALTNDQVHIDGVSFSL